MSTTKFNRTDVSEVIQTMRTLTTAQIRKQLEHDCMHPKSEFRDRFSNVADFFQAAKEQMKQ